MFKIFEIPDNTFVPEGIFGLGVSPTSPTRDIENLKFVPTQRPYTSFVCNLAKKGLIDKAFSLYFHDELKRDFSNSEFALGGFNEKRVTEAPHYIPIYRPGDPNDAIPWQAFGQDIRMHKLSTPAGSQEWTLQGYVLCSTKRDLMPMETKHSDSLQRLLSSN